MYSVKENDTAVNQDILFVIKFHKEIDLYGGLKLHTGILKPKLIDLSKKNMFLENINCPIIKDKNILINVYSYYDALK